MPHAPSAVLRCPRRCGPINYPRAPCPPAAASDTAFPAPNSEKGRHSPRRPPPTAHRAPLVPPRRAAYSWSRRYRGHARPLAARVRPGPSGGAWPACPPSHPQISSGDPRGLGPSCGTPCGAFGRAPSRAPRRGAYRKCTRYCANDRCCFSLGRVVNERPDHMSAAQQPHMMRPGL